MHTLVSFDFHHHLHLAAICNWKCSFISSADAPHICIATPTSSRFKLQTVFSFRCTTNAHTARSNIHSFLCTLLECFILLRSLGYILMLWRVGRATNLKPMHRHTSQISFPLKRWEMYIPYMCIKCLNISLSLCVFPSLCTFSVIAMDFPIDLWIPPQISDLLLFFVCGLRNNSARNDFSLNRYYGLHFRSVMTI